MKRKLEKIGRGIYLLPKEIMMGIACNPKGLNVALIPEYIVGMRGTLACQLIRSAQEHNAWVGIARGRLNEIIKASNLPCGLIILGTTIEAMLRDELLIVSGGLWSFTPRIVWPTAKLIDVIVKHQMELESQQAQPA